MRERINDNFYSYAGLVNKVSLGDLMFPLKVTILLTDNCNIECIFCATDCSSGIMRSYEGKDIDVELAKQIIDECAKHGVIDINYSGGEPLLYKRENLIEVLKYGRDKGIKQSMITNAVLLDSNTVDELSKYLYQINVSLHGNLKTHNELAGAEIYEGVIGNLEYLANKKDIQASILYTLTTKNTDMSNIKSVADIAKRHNISMAISRGNYVGRCSEFSLSPTIKDINSVARHMAKLRETGVEITYANCIPNCILDDDTKEFAQSCSSGVGICAIDTEGNVKKCPQAWEIVGKISETNTLANIWNNDKLKEFRSLDWMPYVCKSCKEFNSCKGGCKIEYDNNNILDFLKIEQIESLWNEIYDSHLKLITSKVRFNSESLIIFTKPALKTSKAYVEVVMDMVKDTKTGLAILDRANEGISKDEIKYFLCDLYSQGIIRKVVKK